MFYLENMKNINEENKDDSYHTKITTVCEYCIYFL